MENYALGGSPLVLMSSKENRLLWMKFSVWLYWSVRFWLNTSGRMCLSSSKGMVSPCFSWSPSPPELTRFFMDSRKSWSWAITGSADCSAPCECPVPCECVGPGWLCAWSSEWLCEWPWTTGCSCSWLSWWKYPEAETPSWWWWALVSMLLRACEILWSSSPETWNTGTSR